MAAVVFFICCYPNSRPEFPRNARTTVISQHVYSKVS